MSVRLEKQDSVGHIVLDRPPANSYDRSFLDELDSAIEDARRDASVKAIVVRSANERFFSAGADISVFAKGNLDAQSAFVVCANDAMGKFESTPKVVVAAINGHCLGGGLEIALCCDFRIAAEGSYRIGLPEVTLGLLPGTGGTQRLPRLIGRQKALDLMLTGRTLTPPEALAAGIVDDVVPAGELLDRVITRARTYATGPTFAIGRIKQAAVQGFGMRLDEGLKLERQLLIDLFKSADAKEGVTAFVEKRKPSYTGK
ncbi:MAG: enoyl-CoA hydratase/isomerase family protein [Chloroflexi bacterium]|nr:MAG: enoyl-CoA hydratase/isomerase family protein [Chloroflexota bacterium]TMF26616.1 MAG: enoyl-CoA hydratase/isomerase family protein [Chloroflexota bacterium]